MLLLVVVVVVLFSFSQFFFLGGGGGGCFLFWVVVFFFSLGFLCLFVFVCLFGQSFSSLMNSRRKKTLPFLLQGS
jgi:hypothetical protein